MARETDFEGLVNLYYPSLYRFAFSLTRHESDASDLTQQTFYIWARKGHQLKDKSKVKTWLFTTLHREYLLNRRKSLRFSGMDPAEVEKDLPDIPPPSSSRVDGATVLSALAQIEQAYQAPLALYYLEDYSYLEIAEILEIPLGTVKSRISRGIAQLHRLLVESEPGFSRKEAR